MNYTKLKKAGLVLAAMMMTTSAYAYDAMRAKSDCANAVARGGQYYQASHEQAADKGHHSYNVTGKVKSRKNNSTHNFSCKVRHKEVVNWNVSEPHHARSSNKDNALAVGAGILAIAAIAAAANQNNNHATHDRYENHATGGNPFDDLKYLKRQCRKNLRHHINRAHDRVEKLQLNTAHVHRKSLNGRGVVYFERGGARDLDYNCVFDRRGLIRDGHYQFGRFR